MIDMGKLHIESGEMTCALWSLRLAGVYEHLSGDTSLQRIRLAALKDADHLVEMEAWKDDTNINVHGTTEWGIDESDAINQILNQADID